MANKYQVPERDIIEHLHRRLKAVEDLLRAGKTVTLATYDTGSPPVLAPGELFLGNDGSLNRFDGTSVQQIQTPTSDGLAPTSSPVLDWVKGGAGYIALKVTPITNADSVTYEFHMSTTAGFTPDATTLVANTPANLVFVKRTPANTDLVYGTTYYFRVIAKDQDGAAAPGTESSGSMDKLNTGGLDEILARTITAEHMETVLFWTSALVAGSLGANRVEVGYGTDGAGNLDSTFVGIRAFNPSGVLTFQVDQDGNVTIKGSLDSRGTYTNWGTDSFLNPNDTLDIVSQVTDYQATTPVQVSAGADGHADQFPFPGTFASAARTLTSDTVLHNLIIISVSQLRGDSTVPSAVTVGNVTAKKDGVAVGSFSVTELDNTTVTSGTDRMRQQVFYMQNAPSIDFVNVVFGATQPNDINIGIFEFAGVELVGALDRDTVAQTSTTGNATPTTDVSGTLAQAKELGFAVISWDASGVAIASPTNGYGFYGSMVNPVKSFLRGTGMYKPIVATTSLNAGATLSSSTPAWIAYLVTFKAKAAGIDLPAAGKIRIYSKEDAAGVSRLYETTDEGLESQLDYSPESPDFIYHRVLEAGGISGRILAQSFSPVIGAGQAAFNMADQSVQLTAIWLPTAATLTGIKMWMMTQGVYTANNNNQIGLFTSDGTTMTLVASSTNDGNLWKAASGSMITKPFTTPYAAKVGLYWVGGLWCRSAVTTTPQVLSAVGGSVDSALTQHAATLNWPLDGSKSPVTVLGNITLPISGLSNRIHWAAIY